GVDEVVRLGVPGKSPHKYDAPLSTGASMALYDAFVSYSHAKDKPIAAALQSVVQKLGKPWYRRRAIRVFRDDTSLSATPSLWPSIETALGQSRYFLLLASPEAAASKWVNKEVAHWLDHKGVETVLIGLTDGDLAWDDAVGDFAAREHRPLPPVLAGRFPSEPKWVDLRPYRDGADKGDAKFTELAADFAAAIRGMPKEDLLSQEVRQQRRALTLAWTAAASLLLFAALAGWQWKAAVDNERVATEQKHIAEQQTDIAKAETTRAERNFGAAKSTIDAVVFDLAEGLMDVEGMRVETVRRILGRAEAAVGQLASRIEGDPSVQRSQGAMFGVFSDAYLRIGATEIAADYAQRSTDIFRALVAKDANNTDWQRDLAHGLYQVANVRRSQSDFAKAIVAFRETLDIMRAIAAKAPNDTNWQRLVAVTASSAGEASMEAGDIKGGLSLL